VNCFEANVTERQLRSSDRRERQRREIALLLGRGDDDRATGLIVEHLREFPDDNTLVGQWLADRPAAATDHQQ
jgi:hypothetical protein